MTKIALVQMNFSQDQQKNTAAVLSLMEKAVQMGAELICFPEGALTGYLPKMGQPNSVSINDGTIKAIQELAVRMNLEVYIGASLTCQGKVYNSYLQIADQIDWVSKTHLGSREEPVYAAGQEIRCFQSRMGIIGIAICLESHFPEIFIRCRELGAVAMILPFASPAVCGSREKIWKKILPARAYDNGMAVLAVNLTGRDGGFEYSGGMMAIDPKGEIMASNFDSDEGLLVVEVDGQKIQQMQESKNKSNFFLRRKQELYR